MHCNAFCMNGQSLFELGKEEHIRSMDDDRRSGMDFGKHIVLEGDGVLKKNLLHNLLMSSLAFNF